MPRSFAAKVGFAPALVAVMTKTFSPQMIGLA
jgi:hypothetical protein